MKVVTSITIFNDAVGLRLSASYSEINEETGEIVSDNNRVDRIVTDTSAIASANELKTFAQNLIK